MKEIIIVDPRLSEMLLLIEELKEKKIPATIGFQRGKRDSDLHLVIKYKIPQ